MALLYERNGTWLLRSSDLTPLDCFFRYDGKVKSIKTIDNQSFSKIVRVIGENGPQLRENAIEKC